MKVPEKYRLTKRDHPMASTKSDGNNGVFIVPHYGINDYEFACIVSDGLGWQHVSVHIRWAKKLNKDVERCPTWGEMCFIKSLFWEDDETVVQFHPAKSDYVNLHKYCLHLWRPVNVELPMPIKAMI
jgi:hypothetical protein